MVAESFGTQLWAVLSDEGTVLTTTSSFSSSQSALCVLPTLFASPTAGMYCAFQWYCPLHRE